MKALRREQRAHAAFLRYRETRQPDAITEVFDAVSPQLVALATHLLRDRAAADDVVQATLLDAIELADDFDAERPLIPWLSGILLNHVRSERRRARRGIDARRLRPRTETRPPDEEAAAREFAELFATALERLPERYREVVAMRLVQGLEPAQIATELRRPRETVKTQLARGLAELRRRMPHGVGPALAVLAGTEALPAASNGAPAEAPGGEPFPAATRLARTLRSRALRLAIPAVVLGGVALVLHAVLGREPAAEPDAHPGALQARGTDDAAASTADSSPRGRPTLARTEVGGSHTEIVLRFADGSPAAFVEVALRPAEDRSWLRETRRTTDADGTLRVPPALSARPFTVRSSRGEPPRTVAPDERRVTVDLPPGIVAAGRVVDAQARPIAGARLVAAPRGDPPDFYAPVARTDEDGRFRIRDLPPRHLLGVLARGHAPAIAFELGDGDRTDLLFECLGASTPIHGRVVDARGAPIAGAAVQVGSSYPPGTIPAGLPSRVWTDADGRFSCDDQGVGPVAVFAGAPGYAPARVVVERASRLRTVEIVLDDGADLSGRVLWSDDRTPVGGASLEVRMGAVEQLGYELDGPLWARPVAVADREGAFRVDALAPGDAWLVVGAEGGATRRVACLLRNGVEHRETVLLGRATPLEGRIVDARGRPLAGRRVSAVDADEVPLGPPLHTDAGGGFAFPGCADGAEITLLHGTTEPWNAAALFTVPVTVRAGHRIEIRVDDASVPSAFFDVAVETPTGAPETLSFVTVHVEADGATFTASDEVSRVHGRFRIGPLLPGRYALLAFARDLGWLPLGERELGIGETVDLGARRFLTPGRVELHVVGPGGTATTVDELVLRHPAIARGIPLPLVGGAGVGVLQPGRWLVTWAGREAAPLCLPVDVGAGEHVVRDVALGAGVEWAFRWAEPPGDQWQVLAEWRTADGRLVFEEAALLDRHVTEPFVVALVPGDYRVAVRDALGRVEQVVFTADESRRAAEPIVLPVPTGR